MTVVETTVLRAGSRIKYAQRKIELDIEGCPPSYVTELVIEGEDGKNVHALNIFSLEPTEFYRLVSNEHTDMLDTSKELLEAGMLVRQVDALSPEVMRPLPTEDDEDDEGFQSWSDEVTDESIDP